MRYSTLFGKTFRQVPTGAEMVSHQLLLRGGFIAESSAGRYFYLPLGWRVHEKIKKIIKEEMDKAGAQEMITPVLHPLGLWQETNRTKTTGFELMTVTDRRKAEFALGGTAEEMFVDVVRQYQLSYQDLPFNVYQFSTKFRDELRARGGLLRVREFVMKDAYSFDVDEDAFKKSYETMWKTYEAIYQRLGLDVVVVESDNGYIGGEYCHEFVVESTVGESTFFKTKDGSYAAHEDVAVFDRVSENEGEEMGELKEVEAKRGTTMADGVALHKLEAWRQMKNVLFVDDRSRFILACIRGDRDVNEVKLKHATDSITLRPASDEEVALIKSVPGFISPVGLEDTRLVVVVDESIPLSVNMFTGANALHRDMLNVNYGRDFKADVVADIAKARAGDFRSGQVLVESRGIEVGNIFQLGYHYTKLMKGAEFVDRDGKRKPYYMGCYGIGLGRTLATLVEVFHDEKGMMWPEVVAPFEVHLIDLGSREGKGENPAEEIYQRLHEAGVEVLFDDRDERAGVKFADGDLIGIPIRLVVSPRNEGKIEWKRRSESESELLDVDEVMRRLST